jgi:hypothetical protein
MASLAQACGNALFIARHRKLSGACANARTFATGERSEGGARDGVARGAISLEKQRGGAANRRQRGAAAINGIIAPRQAGVK